MRYFLLRLLFCFFIFLLTSGNHFAMAQQGQGGSILNVNPPVQNPNQTNQQGVEDIQTKLRELTKYQDIGCGKKNQPCCSKERLKKAQEIFKIKNIQVNPAIDWLLQGLVPDINSGMDELAPIMEGVICAEGYPKFDNPQNPNVNACTCGKNPYSLQTLCSRITNQKEQNDCIKYSNTSVWTALGPIDFTLRDFIAHTFIGWGIGLAGVITLFCIIYSAFVLQISGGNPEKIKKAKERLTACIVGLLLIIFSIFILKIIGFDILRIPTFG